MTAFQQRLHAISRKYLGFLALAIVGVLAPAASVQASISARQVIDFNDLQNGQIVDDEFSGAPFNLTVSGVNIGGGPDLIVAFDTFATGTADPDLEDPFSSGNAQFNNVQNGAFDTTDLVDSSIPSNFNQEASRFQIALIIQENDIDANGDGFLDSPDDEGSRPAGSIFFDFVDSITEIGFDLLDIEGPEEFGTDSGFVATFFDDLGNALATVGFDEFLAGGEFANSANPVQFGNNSANRILPITAQQLSEFTETTIDSFNRVELNFGGSGAVDNLTFAFAPEEAPATLPVPEASSFVVWLLLLGLCLGGTARPTVSSLF